VESVESVRAQTLHPREILLVVDHSPPVAERARDRWPDLTVIENPEDAGVSNARNAAIERAQSEVIAFVDDDAVAEPSWLETLLRGYDESSLAVGGSIEPVWQAGRPRWFPAEFGWVVGCSYTGLPDRPAPVRNVIGTNMSFRREVFEAVGGFDNRVGRKGSLPIGCDETELCIRARRRWPDRDVVYDPAARVAHKVPPNRGTWRYFLSRCYSEGRSKAVVARLAGSTSTLSTELRYSTRVLPAGIARELHEALTAGDGSALGRAAAIVLGLGSTSLGFAVEWIDQARGGTQ
jgi:GT2 family glycosyltransferase